MMKTQNYMLVAHCSNEMTSQNCHVRRIKFNVQTSLEFNSSKRTVHTSASNATSIYKEYFGAVMHSVVVHPRVRGRVQHKGRRYKHFGVPMGPWYKHSGVPRSRRCQHFGVPTIRRYKHFGVPRSRRCKHFGVPRCCWAYLAMMSVYSRVWGGCVF